MTKLSEDILEAKEGIESKALRLTELEAINEKKDGPGLTDEEAAEVTAVAEDLSKLKTELGALEDRQAAFRAGPEAQAGIRRTQGYRPLDPGELHETIPAESKEDPPKWSNFGEMLQAVARADTPGGFVDPRLRIGAATGLSEGVPADGGFLVGQDIATTLLQRVYEIGAISSRAWRVPISANSNGLKINGINETSRADGSRWGGIQAYWAAEAAAKTASQPEFRQIELSLQKLIGLCYATDELLQDAAALNAILSQKFAEEINFKVEDGIVNGTGAGQPLGILASGCLVTVPKEVGQAATTIVYENITKMWSRLWGRSQLNAIWLINQDVNPELMNMGITVGTGGNAAYMPPGGLSQSPYGTLFGRPVIPVEYCATLGTVGDIILADFSQYVLIDKGGIEQASSIHVKFTYDETTFRFVYRVDGQPTWNAALTPYKGTNTQSPFVVLATRA